MDIRERLKKKLTGEIDAEEDFRKYQQRVITERKEQEKAKQELINNEIKKQVNNINSNFNKENSQNIQLPTVKNTSSNKINNNSASNYRNTVLQENSKKILPTNVRLSTAEEKNNFNKLRKGTAYRLTNGKVDDRTLLQKATGLQSSEAFDDGYQAGDIIKTAGSTLGDISYNIIKGAQGFSEGIADKISYGIADIADSKGNKEFANRLRKNTVKNVWQETTEPFVNALDKNSISGNRLDSVFQGVGQCTMQGAISLTPCGKFIMPVTTYLSSSGNAETEALLEGATPEEARIYSRIAGAGETITEYLAGGITSIGGKLGISRGIGDLDDKLAKALSKRVNSILAKNIIQMGVKASGEGLEEVLSGTISAIGKKLTYMKEEDIAKLIKDQNLLEQFIVGTMSAGISQAPGGIISTINNQEYINLPTKQERISNNEVQQRLQEAQDIINNVQKEQGQVNKTTNTQTQQIMQEENKVAENGLSGETNHKQQQFDIIQKVNPRDTSLSNHTWIDNVKDIQTFQEALQSDGYENDGLTPDFLDSDVKKALDTGKVTVYSSYPIENGIFVTPSKMEAQNYVGNGQVYSKEVNLNDVAWLDSLQGQYAKVNNSNNVLKLENRVQGDRLLNAQDLINDIKEVGAKVDDNGYVTLYHRTTPENAKQILETGKMSAKEDGLFFSTNKNGMNNSNYGDAVIKLKVPAEMLELNDIFDDEASIRIPLNSKNENFDIKQYIDKNDLKKQKNKINDYEEYQNIMKKTETEIRQDVNNTIDRIYNGIQPQKSQIVMKELPKVIQNLGVSNEPLIATPTTLRNSILTKEQAEKLGYPTTNNNYHGLGKIGFNNVLDDLYSPVMIIRENEKKIIVFTEEFDYKNRQVIVPIEINTESYYNTLKVNANVFLSAHGRSSIKNYINNLLSKSSQILYENKKKIQNLLDGRKVQYPESISSVSNNSIPQNNTNMQVPYSKNAKTMQDILPTASQNVKDTVLPTPNKTMQDAGAPKNTAQEQNISYNLPIDEKTKSRKHYKSIIQSQYITDEAKKISKDLMKTDTYVPESNDKQLERADRRIELAGADSELESLLSRAMTGGNIKADDIAVGERLIQYYSKTGNKAKLQDAIQATAMAGTTAGQTVQALSLLNHQTPEGQAVWLQRSVEKMNNDLKRTRGEKAEQFNLTPEMTEKIVNSKNNEELQNNLNDVYKELGQQVTKTIWQKIDSWRYFAMLANPRTHIRNIVGNVSMAGVQTVKNKIAGGIEAVVNKFNPEMERTHTIIPASEEIKQFAKNDIKNVSDRLGLSQNKYNPKTRLENSMKTFKTDALEKTIGRAYKINDNALETEDGVGLKHGYVKALSEYMTANKLTPENITDKQLSKARNYAVEQARQATFHQDARLASLLNQLSNKNKFSKFMLDAIVPYKKTPINIAKEGMNYSPVGLVYHATMDIKKVRNGEITVNQYIDNVSKGLTGTGIALVGYALASAGILSASGSDDEDKQQYEEALGNQTYSIKIGDNTYSLDWIAPSGIPLFIGAEIYEIMQQQKEIKTSSTDDETAYNQAINSAVNILDAFTNAMNPMTEMSMLSGLASALKSYDGDNSKMLANLGVNAVKSYVNQFVPTVLGQVAKTTDEYERSTTSTKTGTFPKAIDSTKNYAMSKIPGLRQMLPTKTDVWGNELKQSDNIVQRALENSVLPWTRKKVSSNAVDKELSNVYDNTGENSVLPDSINKNLTIDKQKYVMTSEEYAKYKKEYGQNSYNLLNKLVNSTKYKKLDDSQKQIAIEKVYEYAKEQIKIDYAKNNNLNYEESRLSETLNALKKSNANTSNYLEYIALTKDMDKTSEKITVLASSDFTDKTKQVIYENYIKSENDSQYGAVKASGMNITEYLKFKTQEFESDKKDDGTLTGQTVSNSKKKKIVEYLNSMKITGNQRLLLYAMQGYTTTASQKTQLANYVQGLDLSKKEKLKLYDKFSGFTVYKNGTVKW